MNGNYPDKATRKGNSWHQEPLCIIIQLCKNIASSQEGEKLSVVGVVECQYSMAHKNNEYQRCLNKGWEVIQLDFILEI